MSKSSELFRINLKALFDKSKWSQAELGKRIGVSQAQARNYLEGLSSPPFDILDRIAKTFGVSVADLYKSDTPPEPRIEHHPLATDIRDEIKKGFQDVRKILEEDVTYLFNEGTKKQLAKLEIFKEWNKKEQGLPSKLTDEQAHEVEEYMIKEREKDMEERIEFGGSPSHDLEESTKSKLLSITDSFSEEELKALLQGAKAIARKKAATSKKQTG